MRFKARNIPWVGNNMAKAIVTDEYCLGLTKIRVNYFIMLADRSVENILKSVLLTLDFSSLVQRLVYLWFGISFFLFLLLGLFSLLGGFGLFHVKLRFF